jgi:hypothetical protein
MSASKVSAAFISNAVTIPPGIMATTLNSGGPMV